MACVNSDGTLTLVARDVLKTLDKPRSVEEIGKIARQPIYRVRASLREMGELGLVADEDDRYIMTETGRAMLGGEFPGSG